MIAALLLSSLLAGCEASSKSLSQSPSKQSQTSLQTAEAKSTEPSLPNRPAASNVQVQIADFAAIEKLIARHRGKVVVVDIWATTCPPCKEEFHHLVELHRKYGSGKIACVSVSLDFLGSKNETPEDHEAAVLKFLSAQGTEFDNIIAAEDSDTMLDKLQIDGPPAVFVYDTAGELRQKFAPDFDAEDDAPGLYDRARPLVAELIE
jgi:thiol-disulfide isomerase/thioredoxin